jgi:GNAT superfamily N-acetyltransferase
VLLAELGDEGKNSTRSTGKLEETGAGDGSGSVPGATSPDSERFLALLARDESGTAVGVLTLSVSFAVYAGGEYGVIDEMYVVPEHRSQGIGRRLVEAAVDVAAERVVPAGCDGPVGVSRGYLGAAAAQRVRRPARR